MPVASADVGVAVSVSPGIQAEFDAVKAARLMRHINTIVMTMQEAMYPPDSDQPGVGGMASSTAPLPSHMLLSFPDTDDVSANKDRDIVTAAAMRDALGGPLSSDGTPTYAHTPSATHCFVDVTVDLPLISIELLVTQSHSVTFLVSCVEVHVLVRQNDLQVYFALRTLELIDSLRGADNQAIISTPPLTAALKAQQRRHKQKRKLLLGSKSPAQDSGDHGDHLLPSLHADSKGHRFGHDNYTSDSLLSVTYTYMYNRQSPLFVAHGQEVAVELSGLGLSIDEEAVLRLKPFLAMLSREMTGGAQTQTQGLVPTQVTAPAAPVVAAVGPIGIIVTVSVGSVALSLLRNERTKPANVNSNTNGNINSNGRSTSGSLIKGRDPRAFSPIRTEPTASLLEGAYTVEMTDMFAVIDMRMSTAADVRLRSFILRDCRPSSKGYVYREMLCRSTLGSEHNSVAYSAVDRRNNTQGQGQNQGPKTFQDEDSDLLTVSYREESKHAGTVEVELRNIASFLSMDGVIELSDVAMLNVAAVMSVGACISGTAPVQDGDEGYLEDRGRVTPTRSDADQERSSDSPFGWINASKALTPDGRHTPIMGSVERKGSVSVSVSPMLRQRSLRAAGSRVSRGRTVSGASSQNTTLALGRVKDAPTQATPQFLLNAIVTVVSPRLLLLEDPESADSRSIVIRSGVSVHYCNDVKPGGDTLETLHVSLQTLEIFALTGLTQGRPQQMGKFILPNNYITMYCIALYGVALTKCCPRESSCTHFIDGRSNLVWDDERITTRCTPCMRPLSPACCLTVNLCILSSLTPHTTQSSLLV
jgi:hypothetical protein